jgi:Flp pilus assembly protein TadG
MKLSVTQNRKNQKGAVLIEFVFVAAVLLIIFGLIIELGLLMYNKNVIDNASRVGARAAIVADSTSGEVVKSVTDYCEGRLINLADGRTNVGDGDVEIDNATPGDGDILVRVRYQHTFQLVALIDGMLGILGAGPVGLETLRIEGVTVMRSE